MRLVLDILKEFSDAGEQTRSNVCVALGAVGTPDAVRRLTEIGLGDPSPKVRQTAATEILSLPEELSRDVVRSCHEELFSNGDWLSRFDLLHHMASQSERPLAKQVRIWPWRVFDALRLNLRLRTTRSSPLFILRQLPYVALFVGYFLSAFMLAAWLEITGPMSSSTDDFYIFALMAGLVVWPIMAAATPPRLFYLAEEAPYADVLWLAIVCCVGFPVVVLYLHYLDFDPVSLGFWRTALLFAAFVVLPVAGARLGVAAGALMFGRVPYFLTGMVAGLGAAALVLACAVVAFEMGTMLFPDTSAARDLASQFSIFGIACALFLCCFYGTTDLARGERPLSRRRFVWRLAATIALGLTLGVMFALVSVLPGHPLNPAKQDPVDQVSLQLSDVAHEEVFNLANGGTLGLKVNAPGKVDLELTGQDDVVLEFDGEERDASGQVEQGSWSVDVGDHRISVRYYHREPRQNPETYLWTLQSRFMDRLFGSSVVPTSSLVLSVVWTPDP